MYIYFERINKALAVVYAEGVSYSNAVIMEALRQKDRILDNPLESESTEGSILDTMYVASQHVF